MQTSQEREATMSIGKIPAAHGCLQVRDCYLVKPTDFSPSILSLNRDFSTNRLRFLAGSIIIAFTDDECEAIDHGEPSGADRTLLTGESRGRG